MNSDEPSAETRVGQLLSFQPIVLTGLISYSLYLWHWPIIVFARQASIEPLTGWHNAALLALTFAVAAASWRFVEQPLRAGTWIWRTRRQRFAYAGAAIAIAVGIGAAADLGGGFPQRIPRQALALSRQVEDFSPLRKRCHADGRGNLDFADTCVTGRPGDRPIVLLADSHGAELGFALWEQAEAARMQVRVITASGCPPSVDFKPPSNRSCHLHVTRMLAGLQALPPATVIMIAYYAKLQEPELGEGFWDGFEKTVGVLKNGGHNVILLGGVAPHDIGRVPDTLTRWSLLRREPEAYRFDVDRKLMGDVEQRLQRIAEVSGARYIPLLPALCGNETRCRAYRDGDALFFDTNHLTVATARHLVRTVILPAIQATPPAAR